MLISSTCAFRTERLLVKEWHSLTPSDWHQQELANVVATMLTPAVTQSLPTPWHGTFSAARAQKWIRERDEEGTTLLVINKQNCQAIGLMILFELDAENGSDGVEIRLGYLIAESAWGQGFASEMVEGFVGWCRDRSAIWKLAGGVEQDNPASKRVLEKNGFQPDPSSANRDHSEQIFGLILQPPNAATK